MAQAAVNWRCSAAACGTPVRAGGMAAAGHLVACPSVERQSGWSINSFFGEVNGGGIGSVLLENFGIGWRIMMNTVQALNLFKDLSLGSPLPWD